MRSLFFILAILACGCSAARAEDTAATKPADPDADKRAVMRDPFWPVAYAPRGDSPASAVPGSDDPQAGLQIKNLSADQQAALGRRLRVSGIMKTGSAYLARLNNQLVGDGDEITLDFEGQPLTLVVRTISKNSIQIEPKP